jgi:DNA-binding NtrC family response regulator
MTRLVRDRYVRVNDAQAWDLATGDTVLVRDDVAPCAEAPLDSLVEVLDHGREGMPRWLAIEARGRAHAATIVQRAAADACARGFVPVDVGVYTRLRESLEHELQGRALVLIAVGARTQRDAQLALVDAAARSPRPHLLLTVRVQSGSDATLFVREARAVYAGRPASLRDRVVIPVDVAEHIRRLGRVDELVARGRHAAAERLLREVAAALDRRGVAGRAARARVRLGRLLLGRGRASAADGVFEDAIAGAAAARDDLLVVEARLWQALARTDSAKLTPAEAICRALAAVDTPGNLKMRAMAVLARILVCQDRIDEAAALELNGSADDDDVWGAWVDATRIRVLVRTGALFEAGRLSRALIGRLESANSPLARVIAHTARLRVVTETGDVVAARDVLGDVLDACRLARAPLHAIRARVIWAGFLRRAGREGESTREFARLRRVATVTPPLLRRAIEARSRDDSTCAQTVGTKADPGTAAISLLRLAQDEDDDRLAVKRVMEWASARLQASRVDLVSNDAGPVSVIASAGAGIPTAIGGRVLEAGIVIGPEAGRAGRELGVPVRSGVRLVGALVARWPIDRTCDPAVQPLLDLIAAVAGPRIDALVAGARERAEASTTVPELVGVSAAIESVRKAVARAASAPFSVLIDGESGTGKELVARAVHQLSARRQRRFCDVNCAALPDELLESELFGHARGAFTGAVAERAGLFEEANGGTLFLDEVADLSPRGQAKLLRAIQQQEVRRVGEGFSRKVDVRLVAAVNRDMQIEVEQGRFRQDLLYRLDVVRIRIPPLRDRLEDVPVLATHFWRTAAERVGCRAVLTHGVLAALASYHWPGNVRELQNVMSALAVASPARGPVRPSLLPAALTRCSSEPLVRLADARRQCERRCVEVAIARAAGNRARAARELGVSRQGLMKLMARLGLATATPIGDRP